MEPRAHLRVEELDFARRPFAIVGCDGVWDVLSDQEAVDAVRAHAPDYAHGSTDNVSALVIDVSQL